MGFLLLSGSGEGLLHDHLVVRKGFVHVVGLKVTRVVGL